MKSKCKLTVFTHWAYVFFFVPCNPQFSTNVFHTCTNYSFDHAADSRTFLSLFGYIYGHQGTKCIFFCMCPTTFSFQPTFTKLAPFIHWTMLHTPVHCLLSLVTFVVTRGPIVDIGDDGKSYVIFHFCTFATCFLLRSYPN